MKSHGPVRVHQTGGYGQSHDSAQQAEILNKCGYHCGIFSCQWIKKAEIHGNAAELERKIPPVIGTFKFHKKKESLFVKFHKKQGKAAGKENGFRADPASGKKESTLDRQQQSDDGDSQMENRIRPGRNHLPGSGGQKIFKTAADFMDGASL